MIRSTRLIIALVIVLILSVALIGCVEQQVSSRLLIDQISLADENLKTYELEMDVTQAVSGTDAGEAFSSEVSYNMIVASDKKHQKMNIIASGTSSDQGEIQSEITIIGNTWYIKGGDPSNPDMWIKTEVPQGALEQQDTVAQYRRLLEASDFKVTGTERVNNVNSYCVMLEFTPEQKLNFVAQQGIVNPELLAYALNVEDLIPTMSIKYWYDEQTLLPVRMTSEMTVVLNSRTLDIDLPEGQEMEVSIDIKQETNIAYQHIDEPVSIVLSAEAKNAIEVN